MKKPADLNKFIQAIRDCAESAGPVSYINVEGRVPWRSSGFDIAFGPGATSRNWHLCCIMDDWDDCFRDHEKTYARLWERYFAVRHAVCGAPFWWSEAWFETFSEAVLASTGRQAWLRDFARWLEAYYV